MPRENMKYRNEAHILHQSSQALLRRLLMAHQLAQVHAGTLHRLASVLDSCTTDVPWPLTDVISAALCLRRTQKNPVPVRTKPEAHTPEHMVVRL